VGFLHRRVFHHSRFAQRSIVAGFHIGPMPSTDFGSGKLAFVEHLIGSLLADADISADLSNSEEASDCPGHPLVDISWTSALRSTPRRGSGPKRGG
jgi:hypothetical protein